MQTKAVGAEHVQAGVDAVIGLDPAQAPGEPAALASRLSVAQPGVLQAFELLAAHLPGDQLRRIGPVVFSVLESAARAYPDIGEISPRLFATSIAAAQGEARALLAGGAGAQFPFRERQPALVAFLESQLAGENSFTRALSLDDRLGMMALGLGTVRAVDRQLSGPDQPVRVAQQPGRNDPCPCGSGKKYKKCHGA